MDVDVDNPDSWPAEVRARIDELIERSPEGVAEAQDRPIELMEIDADFIPRLSGHTLVAYHCTRLTDEDAASVRAEGLRKLSRELVEARIDRAEASGQLNAAEAHACREGNVYAIDNTMGRTGQVCFVLGRATLTEDAHGLWPLMASWGGESIHGWPLPGQGDQPVRCFGRPAIVAAGIRPSSADLFAPPLVRLFIEAAAGRQPFGEVFYRGSIPSGDIIGIWHPGDAEYDRHAELPRN